MMMMMIIVIIITIIKNDCILRFFIPHYSPCHCAWYIYIIFWIVAFELWLLLIIELSH